ncbi:GxxExxY protein [bacterium]|nr:GxxExxY protein [bacterium]
MNKDNDKFPKILTLLEEELTSRIISAAIEVHNNLGPGLLESVYESGLAKEFDLRHIKYERQSVVPIQYKGSHLGDYRIDMLVENKIILELKAVSKMNDLFKAQLFTYMKLMDVKLGLLINFNVKLLKDGITRVIL